MNFNTIGYWILESIEGIKKNKKTFFIGLGTMFFMLTLIGGLYIIYLNANSFMGDVSESESKGEIFVNDVTEDDVTIILSKLYQIDGISDIEYVTAEQNYEDAKALGLAEAISVEDNAFHPSFKLTIDNVKNGNISPIRNAIHGIPELYEKIHSEKGFETTETVIKWAITVRVVTWTLLIIFILIGCFIMMNSIKLALYSRRKEISIMKYVGATDRFTKAPFIIEGLIIAILAACITLIVTRLVYGGLAEFAEANKMFSFVVPVNEVLGSMSILLFVVAVGIGTIGSSMSISKYLDV